MVTTKIFRNTTAEDVNVVGVGVIPAGEQVSLTSENHQPVLLDNYPGVIDATEVDVPDAPVVNAVEDATPETVEGQSNE